MRIHDTDPSAAVEEAFLRIRRERLADVPIHNDVLMVEAVDFQRWQGHWLGVVVAPWCMSALLLPGTAEGWQSVGDNQRRFVKFPAGDFAFLGSEEPELGEYQSLSLFSPMSQFPSQNEARLTARACLLAMLRPAVQSKPEEPKREVQEHSPSRRRFLALS